MVWLFHNLRVDWFECLGRKENLASSHTMRLIATCLEVMIIAEIVVISTTNPQSGEERSVKFPLIVDANNNCSLRCNCWGRGRRSIDSLRNNASAPSRCSPRRLVAGVDNRRWAVRTIASLHSLPPPYEQSKRRDDPPGSAPRLSVRLPSLAASLSLDWLKV